MALREDGGFVVPEEMVVSLRQTSEAIEMCYGRLTDSEQAAINLGIICKVCGPCRACYSSAKMEELEMANAVSLGVFVPNPQPGGFEADGFRGPKGHDGSSTAAGEIDQCQT